MLKKEQQTREQREVQIVHLGDEITMLKNHINLLEEQLNGYRREIQNFQKPIENELNQSFIDQLNHHAENEQILKEQLMIEK